MNRGKELLATQPGTQGEKVCFLISRIALLEGERALAQDIILRSTDAATLRTHSEEEQSQFRQPIH